MKKKTNSNATSKKPLPSWKRHRQEIHDTHEAYLRGHYPQWDELSRQRGKQMLLALFGKPSATLQKVAEQFGLKSGERIRQIVGKELHRLLSERYGQEQKRNSSL